MLIRTKALYQLSAHACILKYVATTSLVTVRNSKRQIYRVVNSKYTWNLDIFRLKRISFEFLRLMNGKRRKLILQGVPVGCRRDWYKMKHRTSCYWIKMNALHLAYYANENATLLWKMKHCTSCFWILKRHVLRFT